MLVVRRDEDAIGPIECPAKDARDGVVRVDAIDALDGLALVIEDLNLVEDVLGRAAIRLVQ